tara:strand:+ start:208 stop:414 length:207 start_codon:yes stop_codon:yes gene_type:complete
MKNQKIYNALKILDKIEKARTRNNKNWMDILRLSIKLDYKKTSNLIKEIYKEDTKISSLAKKIYQKKK